MAAGRPSRGSASIASRTSVSGAASERTGVALSDARRVGQERVRLGDLAEPEGEGLHPAAVDGGLQPLRRRPVGPRDGRAVGACDGCSGCQYVSRSQPFSRDSSKDDGVLAGAHVADRAGLLAVPGEARGGQRVERHALVAAGQRGLADAGPAEHALQGPDVDILARVRAGHDRDLGGVEVERLDAAGLDQRDDAERLDGRAERDDPLGIAEGPDEAAVDVRPRRCRRGGRSPRCRCGPGGRGWEYRGARGLRPRARPFRGVARSAARVTRRGYRARRRSWRYRIWTVLVGRWSSPSLGGPCRGPGTGLTGTVAAMSGLRASLSHVAQRDRRSLSFVVAGCLPSPRAASENAASSAGSGVPSARPSRSPKAHLRGHRRVRRARHQREIDLPGHAQRKRPRLGRQRCPIAGRWTCRAPTSRVRSRTTSSRDVRDVSARNGSRSAACRARATSSADRRRGRPSRVSASPTRSSRSRPWMRSTTCATSGRSRSGARRSTRSASRAPCSSTRTPIPGRIQKEKIDLTELEVVIDDAGEPRSGTWRLWGQAPLGPGDGQLQRVVYELEPVVREGRREDLDQAP